MIEWRIDLFDRDGVFLGYALIPGTLNESDAFPMINALHQADNLPISRKPGELDGKRTKARVTHVLVWGPTWLHLVTV